MRRKVEPPVNLETLIIFRVCPRTAERWPKCPLVPVWGSVLGVSACGSELPAALERPAQESRGPVSFAFPSVKQRSEKRALRVVQGRRVSGSS